MPKSPKLRTQASTDNTPMTLAGYMRKRTNVTEIDTESSPPSPQLQNCQDILREGWKDSKKQKTQSQLLE
jgi:hypothetical protein